MKWQPIETAPKNEMILIYDNYVGMQCVAISQEAIEENAEGEKRPIGHKWFFGFDPKIGAFSVAQEPTHWMPLPPSPETSEGTPNVES